MSRKEVDDRDHRWLTMSGGPLTLICSLLIVNLHSIASSYRSISHSGVTLQIEALKMFCDVVAHRSFSRAADANAVSQSSASQIVHQLEERLGVKLIDRSKRPFVLTSEGDLFYRECRKLLDRYDSLIDQVQNLHVEVASRLRVSSIYSVGLSYLNHLGKLFSNQFQQIALQLEYEHPESVIERVETDQADLGVISYAKSNRYLDVIPWLDEPMSLICADDHPLASRAEVEIDELNEAPFVAFDRGLNIRREIDRTLSDAGVTANVVMEFDNVETIKRVVELGDGVAIVPEPACRREVESGSLKIKPLDGYELVRPLGIIHRRGKELSRAARRFVDLLLQQRVETHHLGPPIDAKIASDTTVTDSVPTTD